MPPPVDDVSLPTKNGELFTLNVASEQCSREGQYMSFCTLNVWTNTNPNRSHLKLPSPRTLAYVRYVHGNGFVSSMRRLNTVYVRRNERVKA